MLSAPPLAIRSTTWARPALPALSAGTTRCTCATRRTWTSSSPDRPARPDRPDRPVGPPRLYRPWRLRGGASILCHPNTPRIDLFLSARPARSVGSVGHIGHTGHIGLFGRVCPLALRSALFRPVKLVGDSSQIAHLGLAGLFGLSGLSARPARSASSACSALLAGAHRGWIDLAPVASHCAPVSAWARSASSGGRCSLGLRGRPPRSLPHWAALPSGPGKASRRSVDRLVLSSGGGRACFAPGVLHDRSTPLELAPSPPLSFGTPDLRAGWRSR